MPQKPSKKSHYDRQSKEEQYVVDADRDLFNLVEYVKNFPKVYSQDALPTIPSDSIALWNDTVHSKFYWVVNIDGVQKTLDFAASSSGNSNHSALANLEYIHAGHTGFEPTVSKGDLVGGSPISVAGGVGSVMGGGAYVSIAQATTSQGGYVSATDWGLFTAKADYLFGTNNFVGAGNISANLLAGNTVNSITYISINSSGITQTIPYSPDGLVTTANLVFVNGLLVRQF
jgi:hypothetical protein